MKAGDGIGKSVFDGAGIVVGFEIGFYGGFGVAGPNGLLLESVRAAVEN